MPDFLSNAKDLWFGPVLIASPTSDAVIVAIRTLNREVQVIDRGAYQRVLCKGGCRVTKAAIEQALGREFHLPTDLEPLMPSFKGRLEIKAEEVHWQ